MKTPEENHMMKDKTKHTPEPSDGSSLASESGGANDPSSTESDEMGISTVPTNTVKSDSPTTDKITSSIIKCPSGFPQATWDKWDDAMKLNYIKILENSEKITGRKYL